MTASLHNEQDETASGVTVFTRVFAGEDNADEDDLVWEGKEEVGTLEAGTSHTTTKRVELSLQDAQKVERARRLDHHPHHRRIRRHHGHLPGQRTGGVNLGMDRLRTGMALPEPINEPDRARDTDGGRSLIRG
ncbi:MAG: hypothetical protein U5J98_01395 [Halobacteriales archaeon]|nr:hypothetical protein [Halobacteriales archaeon]